MPIARRASALELAAILALFAGMAFVVLLNLGQFPGINGDEAWTVRRGALEADSATALAFGADGTLYVAGNTSSGMAGNDGGVSPQFASAKGGQDGYLTAFATQADGKPKSLFTTQFG